MIRQRTKNFSGFTLIELLVVIAIIGILSSFIVASFTIAQQKARDSQRKNDLSQIGKALELWRSDTSGGAYYPGIADQYNGTTNGIAGKGYIKSIPKDPSRSSDYCYIPTGTINGSGATGYGLMALVENQNDPDAVATPLSGNCVQTGAAFPCSASTKCFSKTNP